MELGHQRKSGSQTFPIDAPRSKEWSLWGDSEPFKNSDSGRSDRAQWDTPLTTDPILFQSKLRLRKPKPWKPEPSVRSTEILLFITPGGTSSAPGNTNSSRNL